MVVAPRHVGDRLWRCVPGYPIGRVDEAGVEIRDGRRKTLPRSLPGLLRRFFRHWPDGRDDVEPIQHGIENCDDCWPDQHAIGNSQQIGIRVGQTLDLTDHAIAEISEKSACHWRQGCWDRDPTLVEQLAQAVERFRFESNEGIGIDCRLTIDRRLTPKTAPDEVGFQPYHRVSPSVGAPLNGLEQEAKRLAIRNLQECRHRSIKIGDQTRPDERRFFPAEGGGESFEVWLTGHGCRSVSAERCSS